MLLCLQHILALCLVCRAPCESLLWLCFGPLRASLYTAYHLLCGAQALPYTSHPLSRQVRGSAVQAAHTGAAHFRPRRRRCLRVTCPWRASCRAHWTACMSATGRRHTRACQSPAISTGTVQELHHSYFLCPRATAAPRPALSVRLGMHASTAVKHEAVVVTVSLPPAVHGTFVQNGHAATRCRLQ